MTHAVGARARRHRRASTRLSRSGSVDGDPSPLRDGHVEHRITQHNVDQPGESTIKIVRDHATPGKAVGSQETALRFARRTPPRQGLPG
jgi:hypothetical protein